MTNSFNRDEAKKFLSEREESKKQVLEEERKLVLQKTIEVLRKEFHNTSVEVYLVGSLIRPFSFSSDSDVDIVLKNYVGDRFDIWTKIEKKIERPVEIILFERCHFQDFILEKGVKVV